MVHERVNAGIGWGQAKEPVLQSNLASLDSSFIPEIGEGTAIAKIRTIGSF